MIYLLPVIRFDDGIKNSSFKKKKERKRSCNIINVEYKSSSTRFYTKSTIIDLTLFDFTDSHEYYKKKNCDIFSKSTFHLCACQMIYD